MQNRRDFEKEGKVSKNDGKQIDHKKEMIKGGSNKKSNLHVTSARTNLHKEGMRKRRSK